jgi:hypothetical protein
MDNMFQTQAEMKELNYEKFFGYSEGAETKEGTNMPIKDQDTTLSMIVLLLVCLGLAALAHVVV